MNEQELVTILCTPIKLNYLVFGFLYAEGIISTISDVVMMRICEEDSLVDVRLGNSTFVPPSQRTITSGCGGGPVFKIEGEIVDSDLVISPSEILSLMKNLQDKMELYRLSGGVHTSALSSREKLLVLAEDIGRHNTLDKILGECLVKKLPTKDHLLFTTGRVSSEMLLKAAKMQVPVVASRHSPTASAVSLALELGVTLIGHVRGMHMIVYSHPERLGRSS